MDIYLAPLEGITNNFYRESQHKYFGGVDKYYSPFIAANKEGILNTRAKRDVLPENNEGMYLVPQILTNDAEQFGVMCKSLAQYGYEEFNLNLGCPSGTVVSKGRGSGFLAYPNELDLFLEKIFDTKFKISIKTRIGLEKPEEFYGLLEIYNKYPMEELIIHPRTRRDMYKNTPNWSVFEYAMENSKNSVCYNGDIFNVADYNRFAKEFPKCSKIMLGRGLVANPCLANTIKLGQAIEVERLRKYYYDVFESYSEEFYGDANVLHKLKELWVYMLEIFENSEKLGKKLKKAKKTDEFNSVAEEIFALCSIKQGY